MYSAVELIIAVLSLLITLIFLRIALSVSRFLKYEKTNLYLKVKEMQRAGIPNEEIKLVITGVWGHLPDELVAVLK